MKGLKCPLCNQSVSESLYEKITGVWKERRLAEKRFREQEKKLRAQKLAMERQLESERQKLRIEQKAKVRQEVEGRLRKYNAKLERLEAEKGRMRENFDRKVAAAVRSAELRSKREIGRELKAQMQESMRAQIKKATEKNQQGLLRATRTIEATRQQMSTLQAQNMKQQNRIKNLEIQLKNQTTPQLEGLLYEDKILEALRNEFPKDKFDHTGKGGDILQHVMVDKEVVGLIVYECKRVSHWQSGHAEQAYAAKIQRKADYAVLVTNAPKKGTHGFFVEKGAIVINPGGVIAIAGILREQIVRIAQLKLTHAQKEEAIEKTLEYLQGAEFKNGLEVVIRKTVEMYDDLKKECQDHVRMWKKRHESLKGVYHNATHVQAKTAALIAGKTDESQRAIEIKPFPALPDLTD